MNHRYRFLFVCLCACLFACSTEKQYTFGEFNPEKISTQSFTVALHRDVTLTTKAGVRIKIAANTFENTSSNTVEVTVKEVMTKADLLKSGIPTLDDRGQLLESGGMIQILTNPRLPINPKAPIQVRIPANGGNPNMQKYVADLDHGDYLWHYESPLSNQSELTNIAQGKQLFIQHCTSCHNANLTDKLTGPALGCIELGSNRRTRDWLIQFTKNSQKLLAQGDTLAIATWNEYKPTLMTSFDTLSDLEIHHIFDYIQQQSVDRKLCPTFPTVFFKNFIY